MKTMIGRCRGTGCVIVSSHHPKLGARPTQPAASSHSLRSTLPTSLPWKSALRARHTEAPAIPHTFGLSIPLTAKPVKDVSVSVELKLDDDDDAPGETLRGSGITDAAGYALVSLNIPAKLSGDEGELKVVARHGGYVKETSNDIELNDNARIMVTTDKPIYQPGQPLHVRALVFNSANHAAANAEATLKITDPENTNVFQTSVAHFALWCRHRRLDHSGEYASG